MADDPLRERQRSAARRTTRVLVVVVVVIFVGFIVMSVLRGHG